MSNLPDLDAGWAAYCKQLDDDGDSPELGNELAVQKAIMVALGDDPTCRIPHNVSHMHDGMKYDWVCRRCLLDSHTEDGEMVQVWKKENLI